ncbi:hypothetical protein D3C72_2172830 [compost metagenome]
MVADFVRDDIGLRKVARSAELLFKLVEEAHVEIDLAVAGAVERARCRRRKAAG